MHGEGRRGHAAPLELGDHAHRGLALHLRGLFELRVRRLAADDGAHERVVGDLARQPGALKPAVSQHGDVVGHGADLGQVVGHEQDGGALRGHLADQLIEACGLVLRQEDRGLVEHEHAAGAARGPVLVRGGGVPAAQLIRRAHDRHHGPFGAGQRGHLAVGLEVHVEGSQRPPGGLALASPADQRRGRGAEGADREVVEHAQLGKQPEVLMHEREPQLTPLARGQGKPHRLAVNVQLPARIGGVVAGEDLDEGGLARAVLAEQPPDLTRTDGQGHVVEHDAAPERLRQVPDRQRRRPFAQAPRPAVAGRGGCLGVVHPLTPQSCLYPAT